MWKQEGKGFQMLLSDDEYTSDSEPVALSSFKSNFQHRLRECLQRKKLTAVRSGIKSLSQTEFAALPHQPMTTTESLDDMGKQVSKKKRVEQTASSRPDENPVSEEVGSSGLLFLHAGIESRPYDDEDMDDSEGPCAVSNYQNTATYSTVVSDETSQTVNPDVFSQVNYEHPSAGGHSDNKMEY